MIYLDGSEELTGYRVKVMQREAFRVTGYTLIVPPGANKMIPMFWDDIISDGRLERLKQVSAVPTWVLGMGSWDEACEKHGSRYTICIEENEHTDISQLSSGEALFSKAIGASDWLCFEMTQQKYDERFWRDNPYKMMKVLGYRFRMDDPSVGLHFDAFPPDFDLETNPAMEFWIAVFKQ